MVVNKPSGMSVHPGWARDGVMAMRVVRDRIGQWVYPVHRLDRPTSGALIFALDEEAAAALGAAFAAGDVAKRYLAMVRGKAPEACVIDHPVKKGEKGPERVPAVTALRRLHLAEHGSFVEARPRTGRLHQIRRHLKHIAHPIHGDVNYGKGAINRRLRAEFGLHRLALHAAEITFPHPASGTAITVRAPMPGDLEAPLLAMGVPAELLS